MKYWRRYRCSKNVLKNLIFKLTVCPYSLSPCEFYISYINKKAIKLANGRYMISVVDFKRDMIVSSIPQRHQNWPYLLLSVLKPRLPPPPPPPNTCFSVWVCAQNKSLISNTACLYTCPVHHNPCSPIGLSRPRAPFWCVICHILIIGRYIKWKISHSIVILTKKYVEPTWTFGVIWKLTSCPFQLCSPLSRTVRGKTGPSVYMWTEVGLWVKEGTNMSILIGKTALKDSLHIH